MSKKKNKPDINDNSFFTDLDKDVKRENQVYVNEEIRDAVIKAKKQSAGKLPEEEGVQDDAPIPSTLKKDLHIENDEDAPAEDIEALQEADETHVEGEPHPEDVDIYDSLFSDTTIVSTQIYTREMDKALGEDNFTSGITYRVGQDTSDIGAIFTITRKELDAPITVSKPHSYKDIKWYNNLAGLGFSYAAVFGTTVQGIAICEPQYWNNTLYIRHLMVEKDMRRKDVGKLLIEECVQKAKDEGFRAITLEVTSVNGAAVDFYKQMNFNIVGFNTTLYTNSDILKEEIAIFMSRIII